MRPKKDGIPKVVLTITDGFTNPEFKPSLKPAVDQLKSREFNLIAVGIKGSGREEDTKEE